MTKCSITGDPSRSSPSSLGGNMTIPNWFNEPYGSLTAREQREVQEYKEYRDSTVQSDTEAYIESLDKLHAELVENQLKLKEQVE